MDDMWTAIAAIVAGFALALSVINFLQAQEWRIGWTAQRSQVHSDSARGHYRLRNDSRTVRAQVVSVRDNFRGDAGENMIWWLPTLPTVVEPGNWLPVSAHQILEQEPLALTITWRQSRFGGRFRGREHTATVYL